LAVHAREELGIDPSRTGSPTRAAVSSFVSFAVGALIPLIPWFFGTGWGAAIVSIVLGAVAALAIGAPSATSRSARSSRRAPAAAHHRRRRGGDLRCGQAGWRGTAGA